MDQVGLATRRRRQLRHVLIWKSPANYGLTSHRSCFNCARIMTTLHKHGSQSAWGAPPTGFS
ncbi:hypothetical protein CDEST_15525 [Colletotrichum destructivum]|uniref:Uncharacterized protein n=1 Tax=Colletotrichum destructivum TaxID=34406 RepID=A0AAX4J4V5_9PEZI|nr:hypothetical protein CDEST_15525 [Colletotrichum destructivum]